MRKLQKMVKSGRVPARRNSPLSALRSHRRSEVTAVLVSAMKRGLEDWWVRCAKTADRFPNVTRPKIKYGGCSHGHILYYKNSRVSQYLEFSCYIGCLGRIAANQNSQEGVRTLRSRSKLAWSEKTGQASSESRTRSSTSACVLSAPAWFADTPACRSGRHMPASMPMCNALPAPDRNRS